MWAFCVTLVFVLAWFMPPAAGPVTAPASPPPATKWYKGNIHTHTINSIDGEATPDEVVQWYRRERYHFLVLTDHNLLTRVDVLNGLYSTAPVAGANADVGMSNPFLLIPGEELSDAYSPAAARPGERDLAAKQVHLGALGIQTVVLPQGGDTLVGTLQRDIDAVRAAGGIPVINHPNFLWSFAAEDLAQARNVKLLEIFNGHLQSHNVGGGGRPGVEEMWDAVLSAGTLLYAVAADDVHWFQRATSPTAMTAPGRGWIVVRARELTAAAILEAMERGDFYASTGVELADYQVTSSAMTIEIRPRSRSKYQVLFIGQGGKVLANISVDPEVTARTGPLNPTAPPVVYRFRGDEHYVRAKIIESNGLMAWTQPVMLTQATGRAGPSAQAAGLSDATTQPARTATSAPARPPDVVDARYGPAPRNTLDLWLASSARPTPLIVFFHGGGFVAGDKTLPNTDMLTWALSEGVSFASVRYQYAKEGVHLPAPMYDGARAIQFLRSKAGDWNLDSERVAAYGVSAGAGIALWVGFHDDLANPWSTDPIARQSSRLRAIGSINGQASYDPHVFRRLLGPSPETFAMLAGLHGVSDMDAPGAQALFDAASPLTYLTKDDPPVFTYYRYVLGPVPAGGVGYVHHPKLGLALKSQMESLGLECIFHAMGDYVQDDGAPDAKRVAQQRGDREMFEFFLRRFHIGG